MGKSRRPARSPVNQSRRKKYGHTRFSLNGGKGQVGATGVTGDIAVPNNVRQLRGDAVVKALRQRFNVCVVGL